jgi:predicted transposase/invertase (TIGR01784 family)
VEIQILEIPQMTERIIFYASKMITEQIRKGNDFDAIQPVVSIIILDFNLIADSDSYHNTYRLYDNNTGSLFTDRLEIHTLELRKLPKESDQTLLFDWLSFIKAEREEDYIMLAEKNPVMDRAYGVLKELSEDEQIYLIEESREKMRRDNASRMKGALKQGLEQGAENEKIKVVKNALALNLDLDMTAKLVNLSMSEVEKIAQKIKFDN